MIARRSDPLAGGFNAPGDKSISHRSLILGGLAKGQTKVSGLLESDDVLNTGRAMAALGASVERTGDGAWTIQGCDNALSSPDAPLDFGNAGTGVRLVMGVAAGAGVSAEFVGDASLSARPMRRVTDPLGQMGAAFETQDGRLPARLSASRLTGIDYTPPIASAQVKSAILLAGLGANGSTIVREPHATRNHTETMLRDFGVELEVQPDGAGNVIRLQGPQRLTACDVDVPGDPSSSAFAAVAASILAGSDITIRHVMDNPARSGVFKTLQEMGADIRMERGPVMAGEQTLSLHIRASGLKGITVPADRAPSMIDEYPILGVAASFAEGTTRMVGLAELRAKESDRLNGTADLLRNNGVEVEIDGDDLIVHGRGPQGVPGGGLVETRHDHRLAMSGLVMGLAAQNAVTIDDAAMIATSYPDFFSDMAGIGARIEEA